MVALKWGQNRGQNGDIKRGQNGDIRNGDKMGTLEWGQNGDNMGTME